MADMDMMEYFKVVLTIMFFYSFAITLITYYLPVDAQPQSIVFSNVGSGVSLNETSSLVQDSLDRQLNLPVVEIGALVFYSGNILLDMLLNFVFAIPQMVGLLITGLCMLVNIPAFIGTTVQIFASVIMVIMYVIGLIQLVTNVRTGRLV